MVIQFLSQANSELVDAASYYERELEGLGRRFWDEVDEHIAWIARNPEVARLRPGGYRRVNLKLFPYYIPYIIRDPAIWILAIAHGHQYPEYWIDRPKAIDSPNVPR
jgi:plasmid stabilization system protein ParE